MPTSSPSHAPDAAGPPALVFHNGRFRTLDRSRPEATAVAVRDGRFVAVGTDGDILRLAGARARRIDLGGRLVLPGLVDTHLHMIRGGLTYNLELRWDGVRSLADAMTMLRRQAAITPPPQWVRVVGGFSEHQFAEKRLPTLDELNAAAPDTPVFVLHLYDRALLNAAALRAVGYTRDTPDPPGAELVRDARGNPTGLLLAKPNAAILYATLAKGPRLPFDHQLNSTRHFMRELNRLGVTGAIDAGGGAQTYPQDYEVIQRLAADGLLTVRLAYNLFPQVPGKEKDDFVRWAGMSRYKQGDDFFRHNGAGEMLVYSAADFEDFREPRPDLADTMEDELEQVVRILAENRWPWRMHATYDETIRRALDVFERVNQDVPLAGLNWFFDHAETVSAQSMDRIARLGGGIAVQHRMAFQGEDFIARYGTEAAQATPPVARMLQEGLPVAAGTDATRVASFNPWVALAWLITGRTVGGTRIYPHRNCLDRETALRLWTEKTGWFRGDAGRKGQIAPGQLADFIVPDRDFFQCDDDAIAGTNSLLTVVGGKVVYAGAGFSDLDAGGLPPAMPDWSPARGFAAEETETGQGRPLQQGVRQAALHCGCARACGLHGHRHATAWTRTMPASDLRAFWGALGCACWAF